MSKYFLVLDVGTTGTKAFLFSEKLEVVHKVYQLTQKFFPQSGWVEQDPLELLEVSKKLLQKVVQESGIQPNQIISFGLTNQRETTILWDKQSGQPVYPAIVWEDERTQKECQSWSAQFEEVVHKKTGLSILPYFSASKIAWIFQNVSDAQELLRKGNLLFGTVDTWLLWNLLEGQPHVTDVTNASRTLLYNITDFSWDNELTHFFSVDQRILPKVEKSISEFGYLKNEICEARIPARAICGDQQSSFFALPEKEVGTTKITYGTGTFVSQSIGEKFSRFPGTFTTVVPDKEKYVYVIEGRVGAYGYQVEQNLNNKEKLEQIFDQMVIDVKKVVDSLPHKPTKIFVDGGMTQSEYLMKKQAEVLGVPLQKQTTFDGTALGVAKLLHSETI